MPLIQYACLPTARMEMFYSAMRYPDLAVLDFSMNGHALYNYGSLPWLSEQVVSRQSYSTHMTELDIALGDTGRLRRAAEELREKGFRQAFLMPSSVASVLGLDLKALCEELSGPNFTLFTAPARMDADFFAGSEQLSLALARQFARPEEKAGKSGFCLLGGFFSSASGHDNAYITEAIEGALGIPLAFDNLNPRSILDWRRRSTSLPRKARLRPRGFCKNGLACRILNGFLWARRRRTPRCRASLRSLKRSMCRGRTRFTMRWLCRPGM